MKIEWLLLGEGLGADAKGAITVIGLNQNILVASALPTTTKRAFVGHVVLSEEGEVGQQEVRFSLRVENPSGKVLAASEGTLTLGVKPWSELPATFDVSAEVVLAIEEYGAHRGVLEISLPDGGGDRAATPLYVVEPAA